MARWPSPQDYREAIQNPQLCFEDFELRNGQIELDPLQLPTVHCGQHAAVFRLNAESEKWAVRCFLHNVIDRNQRYRLISEFISGIETEYLVDFEFIERGIRVDSEWFPILKMQFLEGVSLGEFIRVNVNNTAAMKNLLSQFEQLMSSLKAQGIAHGDLQHDNIMVAGGKLKLVDYDGMYLPGMKEWKSNELGHRNYQHPGRSDRHFGPYLDNFSAWLIKLSLSCIIEKPGLYHELNRDNESLLLRHQDLISPESSEVLWTIEKRGGFVADQSRLIRYLLRQPLETISSIDHPLRPGMDVPEIVPLQAAGSNANSNLYDFFGSIDLSGDSVLAPFTKKLLFRTSTRSRVHYWQELDNRLKQTFAAGEKEIWKGGMSSEMKSSIARFSVQKKNWYDRSLFWFSLFCMCFAAMLVSQWLLAYLPCVVFFALIIVGVISWPKEATLEPKHVQYVLTTQTIRVIIESGEALIEDGLYPHKQWNTLSVCIPLREIQTVIFRSSMPEQVELIVSPNLRSTPYSIFLHGFTNAERACLRMHLLKLGMTVDDRVFARVVGDRMIKFETP